MRWRIPSCCWAPPAPPLFPTPPPSPAGGPPPSDRRLRVPHARHRGGAGHRAGGHRAAAPGGEGSGRQEDRRERGCRKDAGDRILTKNVGDCSSLYCGSLSAHPMSVGWDWAHWCHSAAAHGYNATHGTAPPPSRPGPPALLPGGARHCGGLALGGWRRAVGAILQLHGAQVRQRRGGVRQAALTHGSMRG